MKKVLSVMLTVLCSISLMVGCTGGSFKTGEPDYSQSDKKLHIGAWVAPPPAMESTDYIAYNTLEQYQTLAASGINTIYMLYGDMNNDVISNDLELLEQVGVDYYVRDSRVSYMVEDTPEEVDANTAFDFYKDKKAFKGHLVIDEPGADKFDYIKELKVRYEQKFPGKDFYINLFPTYAANSYLNAPDYFSYIDQFIDKVQPKMLSYDHYSLLTSIQTGTTSLQEDYLYNKEIIAEKTKKAGIPFWTFIQSIGFGLANRSPSSVGDMRFQVYSDLAYGAKGIQHFTYWTPLEADRGTAFEPAMITADGKKTPIYDYAQTVNLEAQKLAKVLMNYDWISTSTHLNEKGVKNVGFNMLGDKLGAKLGKELPSKLDSGIKSVKNQEDFIIGNLEDKAKGYKGYMLVNYADPGKNLTNKIEVVFKGAKKALVIIKGEAKVVELKKSTYSATLDVGEGHFVIPFN